MKQILTIIFLMLFTIINTTVINIPADQPTIQAGINAAAVGDTVLVEPGTYFENIDFIGKAIIVASLYIVTQDTSYISQTIINGNQSGHVVNLANGEDFTSLLSGFTITNGDVGIRIWNQSTTIDILRPKIDHVNVINNHDSGFYIFYSSPNITNSKVMNNISNAGGGGIFIFNSESSFSNMIISGNSTVHGGYDGGGVQCQFSDIMLNNVEISNNLAGSGSGLWMYYSDAIINDCLITDNIADEEG